MSEEIAEPWVLRLQST